MVPRQKWKPQWYWKNQLSTKTVKSLTLSSSNYNEVRYILTEIFSDKQILISNHMNKFLNLHSGSNNNLYLRQLKP